MLSPKTKVNLRKFRKSRIQNHVRSRGNLVSFGKVGLQALEPTFLTSRQLESARRVLKRTIKKKGQVWLQVFPTIPKTKKPEKTRMGKGKGRQYLWYFKAHPGKIIFEIGGNLNKKLLRNILKKASFKLSGKSRCAE